MQFPERTNLAAHEGISNHPFPFLSPEKLEGIEKYYEAHDAMPKTNAELYKTTDDIAGRIMALIEDMSKNLAPARRYATSVKEARALYEKSITDLRALQPNLQACPKRLNLLDHARDKHFRAAHHQSYVTKSTFDAIKFSHSYEHTLMMVAEHCQKRTSTQLGRSTQKGFISDAAKFLNAMQELRLEAHALAAAQVAVSDSDKLFELSQTFKWTSNIVGPLYAVTVLQAAAAFMVCSLGDLMQMTDLKTADACRQRLLSLGQAELQLKYKLDSLLGDHKSGWELIGMTVMRNPVTRVASYAVQSVVSIIGDYPWLIFVVPDWMKDYERMATARRQASAEEGRAAAAQKKAEAETAKAEQARIRNEQQEKVNQLKEWELHMQVRRTMQSPEQEALEEPMKPPILFGTPNDGGMDTWMAAGMPYSPGLGSAMAGGLPGR